MRRKNNEESVELKLQEFAKEMFTYQLSQIPSQEVLEETYQVSDVFRQKMKDLMDKYRQKEKRREQRRWIAVIIALLLLFGVINRDSIAEAADDMIMWFSDHIEFKYKNDVDINWIPRYEMQYIPKGYRLEEDTYYEGMGVIVCKNQEEELIYLVYGVIDGAMGVNNDDKEMIVIKGEDGKKIYYLKDISGKENSSLTWTDSDETIKFSLFGNFDKEELLKIQENIVIKD